MPHYRRVPSPEPSPAASGIMVQLLRAATGCELELALDTGQIMQRAQTLDVKHQPEI